jgi:hypothetical protein
MSALLQPSLKARLLAAAFACFLAFGTLTPASAGPVLAQADTPNFGASRATEVLPSTPYAQTPQSANVGNPAAAAGSEKRVALVIGNSAYENVTALPNPANDAKAIGQFLNSAGFEVIMATDLDHDEMIQVLQDFSTKISQRGPNTVAFVYYAGHGLQIAGDNYLVPVDAKISSEADVATEAVRLVDVMATLQAVPSRMRAVIIDACRNNPFSSLKDTGRGLAIVDAPNGSIVGYSTAPGTEAFDGEGKNSPYTSAFLRIGREPNLPIEQFFKKVRNVVNDVTEGKQTPWESSSLTSDFYFFGDTAVAAAKTVDPALQANASANRPTQIASNMRTRTPREAYNMTITEGSVEYYQQFVQVYPYDPFADHIRRLLAAKLLAAAWHGAVLANSPLAYKNFYSQYSDSPYANIALKLESQPKMLPLYQPTKIMIAPQIAPQVKLTNFNGVSIGQGNNAPLGLGGNGSLFNKKFVGTQGLGNQGLGNQGLGNQGGQGLGNQVLLGGQNLGGQKLGLPANVQNGNPIATINNGGQGLPNNGAVKTLPGVDLAKGVKHIDTNIGGGRLTTLPGDSNGAGSPANRVGTPGNGSPATGIGTVVTKDVKVPNGNTGIAGHINPTGTGNGNPVTTGPTNGQPLIKRLDTPRITSMPPKQVITTNPQGSNQGSNQVTTVKKFQPGERLLLNGNGGNNGGSSFGNGGGGSNLQFRGTKTMSLGTGSGGGGNGGGNGGRFAGGGMGFGRSFR